jgi:uncharacterized RDD family membrane protein YckC
MISTAPAPSVTQCLECNAPLSPAETHGLCARCLLKMGLASQFGENSVADAGVRKFVPPPMFPFDFGGYRVLRLLGRGGMGAVYEAEQHATGRRVALKVLGHTIDSPEMRKRFLREGRLAASVNHPNSVYIFGTEEIDGAPVIAMELVAGGTLRDRIRKGPLPVREAVDATLQLIAGLEAAASAGVLHRDVKPANCFVTPDGTAKVGDFGLSVSTLARHDSQLTASGVMLGTPSYAPPEQLRGDELDVRADIYSVGATLYSLLTGRPPHEGDNAVQVVAAVLDKAPKPIAEFRKDVPPGLAQVIARCLAKKRDDRFADYAALRDALTPFSSQAREAAPLGLRTVAGIIDLLLATIISAAFWASGQTEDQRFLLTRSLAATLEFFGVMFFGVFYFSIPEGLWGASLGKMLCGLRVVATGRGAPGIPLATLRAFIVLLAINAGDFIQLLISSAEELRRAVEQDGWIFADAVGPAFMFLLFVTMRRRNGFAAIHELLTGTRVVVRSKASPRPRLSENDLSANSLSTSHRQGVPALAGPASPSPEAPQQTEAPLADIAGPPKGGTPYLVDTRLGPFRLVAPIAEGWLAAYDDVLRRNVWIHQREPGPAPLAPALRDLARAGRLRWIAGTRSESENWDAFEAPSGRPLTELSAQPWAAVRCWLLDFAEEIDAASKDETLPAQLGLDQVWITADGRALLLDEPWPGAAATTPRFACADAAGTQQFLSDVASATLDSTRLPLHARDFLQKLAAAAFDRASFLAGNLRSLLARPATLTRRRRFASIALAPALALLIALPIAGFILVRQHQEVAKWAARPELHKLDLAFEQMNNMQGGTTLVFNGPTKELMQQQSERLAKYISGHYGTFLLSPEFDRDPVFGQWSQQQRDDLRAVVKTHPLVGPVELKSLDAIVNPSLQKHLIDGPTVAMVVIVGFLFGTLILMCIGQFVSLLLFRTTLGQRLFGFAVVNQRGEPASRGRLLWRWAIIWVPLIVIVVRIALVNASLKPMTAFTATSLYVKATLWLLCVAVAMWKPESGVHDDIAKTRLVPR